MVFRYWMGDGKATVINDVDRLFFNSLDEVGVRSYVSGREEWHRLVFKKDFVQFTMTTE